MKLFTKRCIINGKQLFGKYIHTPEIRNNEVLTKINNISNFILFLLLLVTEE